MEFKVGATWDVLHEDLHQLASELERNKRNKRCFAPLDPMPDRPDARGVSGELWLRGTRKIKESIEKTFNSLEPVVYSFFFFFWSTITACVYGIGIGIGTQRSSIKRGKLSAEKG